MHGLSEWLTTMPTKRSWCLNVSLVLGYSVFKTTRNMENTIEKIVGDADAVLQVRKLINLKIGMNPYVDSLPNHLMHELNMCRIFVNKHLVPSVT